MRAPTPSSAALDDLAQRLAAAFEGRPRQFAWGAAAIMRQSLETARDLAENRRGLSLGQRRAQRIARSVMALRLQGDHMDFVHLKYACYGLARASDWDSRCLLEDVALTQKLLAQVERLRPDERRFQACCRGLLESWREAEMLPDQPVYRQGREALRMFLFNGI
jgi:hypothetical protein